METAPASAQCQLTPLRHFHSGFKDFEVSICPSAVFFLPLKTAQLPWDEDSSADVRPCTSPAPAPRSFPAGLGFPLPAPVTLPVPTGAGRAVAARWGHRRRHGGHANVGARRPAYPQPRAQLPCPSTAPTAAMDPVPEVKRNRFPSMNFEAEILTAPHDNSELYVTPSMRSLTAEEYVEAFKSFLDHSTEHQCMDEFNKEEMPNIMAGLGNGKSAINVLGVGSGTGEQDLKMIRILQAAHPGVFIDNEIVEPNPQHVAAYKELVNQAPDLQNVSFIWHQLTSSDYEQQVKDKGAHKKFDFIHMIQMLYRVEDILNTIKFFHSCLDHHGKLLIIILSDSSGWASLWKKYRHCLPSTDSGHYVTSNGITNILKRLGVEYHIYEYPSGWDITECFIEGDPVGARMLDFLTGTKNFLGTAPPGLRQRLQEALCQPECSSKKDGRIIFNNNLSMIVVES
ncbi:carnosine N-methyltransferase 2 [Phalacrocorax carbo]